MHKWNAAAAALNVVCGSLRPNVFGATLVLRDQTGALTNIPGLQDPLTGLYSFAVTAVQANALLANNAQVYLHLATHHTQIPGAPTPDWGWRYKLVQGAAALSAVDNSGVAVPLDGQDYFNSPLTAFLVPPVAVDGQTITLG